MILYIIIEILCLLMVDVLDSLSVTDYCLDTIVSIIEINWNNKCIA